MVRFRHTLISTVIVAAISSCGGGGSPQDDLVSNSGTPNDPGTILTNDQTDNTKDASNVSPENSGNQETPNQSSDPAGSQVGVTQLTSGHELHMVVGNGIPVIGLERERVTSLDFSDATESGFMVYGAGVIGGANTNDRIRGRAIWGGSVSAPSLLIESGDTIEGLSPDLTFSKGISGGVAEDGSMVVAVELSNSDAEALMSISGGQPHVLYKNGDMVPGTTGNVNLRNFRDVQHSTNGTAFIARVISAEGSSSTGLWHHSNGQLKPVAQEKKIFADILTGPKAENCAVFLSNSDSFQLLEDGTVIFEAILEEFDLPNLPCNKRTAILSYKDGAYRILASHKTPVPNGNGWVFGTDDFRLSGFRNWIARNDGSLLFATNITSPRIPSGYTYRVEKRYSIWSVSATGEIALVAVNGEETGTSNGAISLDLMPGLTTNASGVIVLLSRTDDKELMLRGTGHIGQPHAALEVPGASALNVLPDSNSNFSSIALTSTGNTIFSLSTTPFGIFEITTSDERLELITRDDVVRVRDSFFSDELTDANVLSILRAAFLVPLSDGSTLIFGGASDLAIAVLKPIQ